MTMLYGQPQVALDLPEVEDKVLMVATLAGEHASVIENISEKHDLPMNQGQVFRMARLNKLTSSVGGPRTRWTQPQHQSVQTFEVDLRYHVIMTNVGDDQRQFLSKQYIGRIGMQVAGAQARSVDITGLRLFPQADMINTNGGGSTSSPLTWNAILRDQAAIQAAADDIDSEVVAVSPTAHIRDLNLELLALGAAGAAGQQLQSHVRDGLTQRLMQRGMITDAFGSRVIEARNSEKHGNTGYTAILRRESIQFVRAKAMTRERARDWTGGGANIMLYRRLVGMRITSWAQRNWVRVQQRNMDIGGA